MCRGAAVEEVRKCRSAGVKRDRKMGTRDQGVGTEERQKISRDDEIHKKL